MSIDKSIRYCQNTLTIIDATQENIEHGLISRNQKVHVFEDENLMNRK